MYMDLDARLMMHDGGETGGIEWGEMMGPVEASLEQMMQRYWLLWRDGIIRKGVRKPEMVRVALIAMQREWERTVMPERGSSPAELIAKERAERDEREAQAAGAADARPSGQTRDCVVCSVVEDRVRERMVRSRSWICEGWLSAPSHNHRVRLVPVHHSGENE